MYEQRRHLVLVVEDEAVAPGDHRTRERPVREAVARDEQRRASGEEPDVYEVEDRHVVAQIEQEVVPRALLVLVEPQREQVHPDDGIRDVYPPGVTELTERELRGSG